MEKIVKGNLIYGQSGGPTSVINSSAYGLFKETRKHKDIIEKVYAMHYGIEGLLNEDIIDIDKYNDEDLKALLTTPGAIFGSNRYKLNDDITDKEKFDKIINLFKKYNIRYFFYNGGNDSMETILKISRYAKKVGYTLYSIGIPKTIDNDLVLLDHTPGYLSAANFIANSVSEIYYDDFSYKKGRINIVEVMGRNTGWLTASSKLAELNGAKIDLIYVPEVDFDLDNFLKKSKEIYDKKGHCLVVISEGIHDKNGNIIGKLKEEEDVFGHTQLGGVSVYLANLITSKFNIKTRYIELSLLQRANSIVPSKIDTKEAIKCGAKALEFALKGNNEKIVTIKRVSNTPYKVNYKLEDIESVANKIKFLPLAYINESLDNISDKFFEYIIPMVKEKGDKEIFKAFKL